ncbi:MAG: pilus assembly protein PilM, partial [Verrucomicrobia bacterium]|nr:pilus assembly protein PilM [Verrucomicrobiota bacterium]
MARAKRILAIDVGASKVVLAEFVFAKGAAPQLNRYAIGQLSIDPEIDTHSSAILVATLRELMRDNGIKPAPLYLSISGQAVFPRYVKLPPVSRDKLFQIVRYEAEQNVPFPIDEVVWDFQLMPGATAADTNVMLVAVKTENVTRLTDCMQAGHLEPVVVDAAPMAIYNAACLNYGDLPGCTLVLDMGARSSNLIFVEEHRIFSRSVPVAGNTITQEIAKAFEISFEEAEEVKKTHGQVDLGGTTEASEDEATQQIAKIARNIMTRLHAEVN